MKTKNSSRSENARNEARDSQGRFTSESNNHSNNSHGSHSSSRGSNARNEERDSQGRFTSESHSGRSGSSHSGSHRGPGRPKGSKNKE